MLKRLKSVSMLLFLMGASTGAAYAVANPGVTDVKITQQSGTCTGIVKDATGETASQVPSQEKHPFCPHLLLSGQPAVQE